jgi:hypothetical protein
MKKKFLFISLVFMLAGMYTGNFELATLSFAAMFIFANDWSAKRKVLAVILYPATITDQNGNEVPMWTRAQKYLAQFLSKFGNAVTKQAIADGSIIWNPVSYYIRANITGLSGRQKILSSATSKVLGICNLDKGQLAQYYNFCYDAVAVRYVDGGASVNDAVYTLNGYSSVLGSMAPGLRNGELIVSLNRQVQIETPINDFGSQAAIVGGATRNFDAGELQVPKVWQEQLQVEVEVNLPVAIPATGTTTRAVEVEFYGIEARLS